VLPEHSHGIFPKKMLVAGFDKVFEIGNIFRSEGLSCKYNPEFTNLEIYQAFSDYGSMMTLVREILQHLCQIVAETTTITAYEGTIIKLGREWVERRYYDQITEATGNADWFVFSNDQNLKRRKDFEIEISRDNEDFETKNDVYSKIVEPNSFNSHLLSICQENYIRLQK
jgi:lysyl-tRNA synthetase class 2